MVLIPSALAALPLLVALTVAAGRTVASLAREARLMTVAWLALRGTRPDQRAEIVHALTGAQSATTGSRIDPVAIGQQTGAVGTIPDGQAGLTNLANASGGIANS